MRRVWAVDRQTRQTIELRWDFERADERVEPQVLRTGRSPTGRLDLFPLSMKDALAFADLLDAGGFKRKADRVTAIARKPEKIGA